MKKERGVRQKPPASASLAKQMVFDSVMELLYGTERFTREQIAVKLMDAVEMLDDLEKAS